MEGNEEMRGFLGIGLHDAGGVGVRRFGEAAGVRLGGFDLAAR